MNAPTLMPEPLPELRDIHLPETVSWWPPALGWWLLAALLVALLLAIPWILRWLRRRPLRRRAIAELRRIREDFRERGETGAAVRQVAGLLRRTLIAYRGRAGYAASTGQAWLEQLGQLAPPSSFSAEHLQLLSRGRFRAAADCDVDGLLRSCERWIRSLPPGRDRVSA